MALNDDLHFKKRGSISILSELSKGAISIEEAQCHLFALLGVTKSVTCKLDRLTSECSIYQNVKKSCEGCGHFTKFRIINKEL